MDEDINAADRDTWTELSQQAPLLATHPGQTTDAAGAHRHPPPALPATARAADGDELLIADANYPAQSQGQAADRVVRMDGHSATAVLRAVLELLPLDTFAPFQAAVMRQVDKPDVDADAVRDYAAVLSDAHRRDGCTSPVKLERLERFAFYERSKRAFAVVATSESRLYGNLILKKGVIGADGRVVDAKL